MPVTGFTANVYVYTQTAVKSGLHISHVVHNVEEEVVYHMREVPGILARASISLIMYYLLHAACDVIILVCLDVECY